MLHALIIWNVGNNRVRYGQNGVPGEKASYSSTLQYQKNSKKVPLHQYMRRDLMHIWPDDATAAAGWCVLVQPRNCTDSVFAGIAQNKNCADLAYIQKCTGLRVLHFHLWSKSEVLLIFARGQPKNVDQQHNKENGNMCIISVRIHNL